VTPIRTRFDAGGVEVALGDELTLTLGRLREPRLRAQPVVTYTEKAGRLLRTRIDVDHDVVWGGGGSARLTLRGAGPLADSARALGLDRARPVAAFRADGFRARLPEGIALGPARESA
jgi:hypothetical protein